MEFEQNQNTKIYWDNIPLFLHADEYSLGIYEVEKNDITEIDTIDEYKIASFARR